MADPVHRPLLIEPVERLMDGSLHSELPPRAMQRTPLDHARFLAVLVALGVPIAVGGALGAWQLASFETTQAVGYLLAGVGVSGLLTYLAHVSGIERPTTPLTIDELGVRYGEHSLAWEAIEHVEAALVDATLGDGRVSVPSVVLHTPNGLRAVRMASWAEAEALATELVASRPQAGALTAEAVRSAPQRHAASRVPERPPGA